MAVNGTRKLKIDFYPGNKKEIDSTKVNISKGLRVWLACRLEKIL